MILYAGVARKIISPPRGIYLIGYGDRSKGNQGVHDDLTATALVLDDGLHRSVIVACDLLAINEHTVARIQAQTGSNIVICCSHTHSAPITYAGQRSPKKNRQYMNFLVEQVVAAVKEAESNLQPARLYWAQTQADIAVNRRERKPDGRIEIGVNPDGPVDHSLSVVQVQAADGKALATLVNFQCHGTVLGPGNLLVSADWIGAMRHKLEQGSAGLVLYLQGATGDLNPDHTWGKDDFEAVESLGLRIAEKVEQAFSLLEPLQGEAVGFQHAQVWLPLEAEAHSPTPPDNYRKVLGSYAHVPRFLVDYVLNQRYPWKTLITARDGFWSVPVNLTQLRVGELALVTLGAEVFTQIGMAIKQASPTVHTLFASVSSGCIGYIPTRVEHALGGYEVDLSPYFYRMPGRLTNDCEDLILKAVSDLNE